MFRPGIDAFRFCPGFEPATSTEYGVCLRIEARRIHQTIRLADKLIGAIHERILPHSHGWRSMIGPYGETGCSPRYDSQTRKPQLGASHSARSGSRY
jgi:hypothetical protein